MSVCGWTRIYWVALLGLATATAVGGEVRFRKCVLDKAFRSEGAAVGDVNRDGQPDVLAGDVWYEAPNWKMHALRAVGKYNPAKGYSNCFNNFAMDVNGDGWVDSITVNFPGKECFWYENPKGKPGPWKRRVVAGSACNETPICVDLLGDGKRKLVFGSGGRIVWYGLPADVNGLWDAHPISGPKAPGTHRFAHGLGGGDVNGDGRMDVMVPEGWWEAPKDRTVGEWKFHKTALGPPCADMHVYDVDGDGDNDIITSSAHKYGIWWFERVGDGEDVRFKQHEIHAKISQTHALHLVDINGDGLKDLVTGKRHLAHNGRDPGAKEPAVLYWFELRRPKKGTVDFVPHKIDEASGVGTQFDVADMNGDGRPDIVTSNKKGVYVFLQEVSAAK